MTPYQRTLARAQQTRRMRTHRDLAVKQIDNPGEFISLVNRLLAAVGSDPLPDDLTNETLLPELTKLVEELEGSGEEPETTEAARQLGRGTKSREAREEAERNERLKAKGLKPVVLHRP